MEVYLVEGKPGWITGKLLSDIDLSCGCIDTEVIWSTWNAQQGILNASLFKTWNSNTSK